MAAKNPQVCWVAYHGSCDFEAAEKSAECMKRHKDVFANITFSSVADDIIEYFIKNAGADRILYGGDVSTRNPRQQLGWVVYGKLPIEDKIKTLGENAAKVIAPCLGCLPTYSVPSPCRHDKADQTRTRFENDVNNKSDVMRIPATDLTWFLKNLRPIRIPS